jgi:hypothetical protein
MKGQKKPGRTILAAALAGMVAWNAKDILGVVGGGFDAYTGLVRQSASKLQDRALALFADRERISRAAQVAMWQWIFALIIIAGLGSFGNLFDGIPREAIRTVALIGGFWLWGNVFVTSGLMLAKVLVSAYAVTVTGDMALQPLAWVGRLVQGTLAHEGIIRYDPVADKWTIVDLAKWRTAVLRMAGKVVWLSLSIVLFITVTRSLTFLGGIVMLYMFGITMYVEAVEQGWSINWGPRVIFNMIRLCTVMTAISLPLRFIMPETMRYVFDVVGGGAVDHRMLAILQYGEFGPFSSWAPLFTGQWTVVLGERLIDGTVVTAEMLTDGATAITQTLTVTSRVLLACGLVFTWLFMIIFGVFLKVVVFSHEPESAELAARLQKARDQRKVAEEESKILGGGTCRTPPTERKTEVAGTSWRTYALIALAVVQVMLIGVGIAAATGNLTESTLASAAPAATSVVAPSAPTSTGTAATPAVTATAKAVAPPTNGKKPPAKGGTPVSDSVDAAW